MSILHKANNLDEGFIVAVDGPAASGKSSLSKLLAQKFYLKYVSSGYFYRVFAKLCIIHNVIPDRSSVIHSGVIDLIDDFLECNKILSLYDEDIAIYTSKISAIPELRVKVNHILTNLVKIYPRIIVEGRDIASVVLPSADLKIFLNANLEQRAIRRSKQLQQQRINLDFSDILSKLSLRDKFDRERSEAPLTSNSSSLVIDSTDLTIDGLLETVVSYIKRDA